MIISFVPVLFFQVLYILYNVNVCQVNSIYFIIDISENRLLYIKWILSTLIYSTTLVFK